MVTRTYSMTEDVAEYVDQLPKNKRSQFVTNVLAKAIKQQNKKDAIKMLHEIKPVKSDMGSVESVNALRNNRLEYLLKRHE